NPLDPNTPSAFKLRDSGALTTAAGQALVSGQVYRVTQKNFKELARRSNLNQLTDDDIATLRDSIKRETAGARLTSAEDDAFRRLTARILSERSLRGDIGGFRRTQVVTPFDDLYEIRNG